MEEQKEEMREGKEAENHQLCVSWEKKVEKEVKYSGR